MRLGIVAALIALCTAFCRSENSTILESFEAGIGSAAVGDWGGARIPAGVGLAMYSKVTVDDPQVTHGSNSLQVALAGSEGWCQDFKVTLSNEASEQVRAAARSGQMARFVLRYDVVFPAAVRWMHSQVLLGSVSDQLQASNRMATMSIALDLAEQLPESGPIEIRFAENFDALEDPFVGPILLFVDNFRLVDTYVPGAEAVVHTLQSFEGAETPPGGVQDFTDWGGTPRTTYSRYAASGPEDVRVAEGQHALRVDYAGPGIGHADFTLPFANTKLAQVLKLERPVAEQPTRAELERYTLRFDVAYPDRTTGWSSGWMVLSVHTLVSGFPFNQSRRDLDAGTRQTFSVTLDQLTWPETGEPKLLFITNGGWGPDGISLWLDNFRLIDTRAVRPRITSCRYDPKSGTFTLTWDSEAGEVYAIEYAQNVGVWTSVLETNVVGSVVTTTRAVTVPSSGCGFIRLSTVGR